ncbi:WecB/TagA/CpsF family glycosyltransferase [Candidatus Peregrinibacteria bacterium]|nr:WecB/TagA/CpsF family glycosyltransferase [Candidatus Peregrinibacteria bacterium]
MPKILDIRVDDITLQEATETIIQWTQDNEQRYVTTPNPEILLESEKNVEFKNALNRADLNIPDGTGILWAAKYQKITENGRRKKLKWILSLLSILFFPRYIRSELRERVTGADLMKNICLKAPKNVVKIFLLGANEGVAERVKEELEKKHKNIEIVGTYSGSPKLEHDSGIIEKINSTTANMLFIAFGAPKQELWIARNLKKLNKIKVAVGVGGTFDFIAGTRKRAPQWLQKIGLEWLYRLIQQPLRIARIYRATIKFPVRVLKSRTVSW